MAPLRGLFEEAARGSARSRLGEDEVPVVALTEESGGVAPDWSSETGEVELRALGGRASAAGDSFHAGVLRLLSMHSQVQQEVTQLREMVAQYECNFKKIQSAMVCSAADTPEMAALMETVSREMAVLLMPEGSPAASVNLAADDKQQEDAEVLTGRGTRSSEEARQGTSQAAAPIPLTPPHSPRAPAGATEQRQNSKQPPSSARLSSSRPSPLVLPGRHISEPIDDDLDPRTALAMGAKDGEELAVLEDDPLHGTRKSSVASSGAKLRAEEGHAAENAASAVGDDAPPKSQVRASEMQVRASVGEDVRTRNNSTTRASRTSRKADDLGPSASAQLTTQKSTPLKQKTRGPSLIAAALGESIEDLPISKRLSKERAAVLTPAGKRVLNRMNRNRTKKKDENGVVVEEGPFFQALRRTVMHPGFDLGCAGVIIANSVLIGWEVDWKTAYDGEMPHMKSLNYVCTVFFLVELILRLSLDGFLGFFVHSENRSWNMFDGVLVAMSLLDALLIDLINIGDDATGVSGGLKTLKMLRIVRVCRVFRFFTELSQLALMIIDSVKSLMWALIMLFIVIYVFAIFFIHGVTDKLRSSRTLTPAELELDPIARHFGSLGQTLQTLFQSMLNGISWYTLTDALTEIHPTLLVLFLFYIAFSMLAVLNIITGVFVDNAVETARTQREYLVQKEMELKEKWCQEMRNLFNEMDADGSGTVCLSEVKDFFNDDRVRSYFIALGLETQDAERLFLLLDEDETGDIDIDMFLNGCLRLKGTARSIDVYQLLQDYRKMNNRLLDMQEAVALALKGRSVRPSAFANGSCTPPGGCSKSNSEVQKRDSRGGSIIVKQF